jgi:uncharacterized protein YfaS (alpha-2-macroglobulin family)
MKIKLILVILLTILLFPLTSHSDSASTPKSDQREVKLLRVTSAGVSGSLDGASLADELREIIFEFDNPVVPLGRMARSNLEVTITITPTLNCEWRWLTVSTLSCKLPSDSPAPRATKHEIKIPRIFDLTSQAALKSEKNISFVSLRPAISVAWLTNWIDSTTPSFTLITNQAVSADELSGRLRFVSKKRDQIKADVSELPSDPNLQLSPAELAERLGRDWIVKPQQKLPIEEAVNLTVSPGLKALKGEELGIENRIILTTHAFPEFKFIGITCRDLKGKLNLISPTSSHKEFSCDPLNAIQLTFNSPVTKSDLAKTLKFQPEIRGIGAENDPWESVYSRSQRDQDHAKDQAYYLNLPYGLKADTTYSLSAIAGEVRDEFGRTLDRDIAASFKTDHRAPRFVLDHQESVLEKNSDSKLPIIVNNLSALNVKYNSLTVNSRQDNTQTTLLPYQVSDIAYPFPLDIRSLLGGRSGVIQGTITGVPAPRYDNTQRFFSQVTPFTVHVKMGHFNSLIWVTDMSTGEPVSDAKVSFVIDQLSNLKTSPPVIASALTDRSGRAELPGISALDPKLELVDQWERDKQRVLARIEKDDDIALVPITWEYQAYDAEIYPSSQKRYGHIKTWGTTAQGIYRAGDTVQFAIWIRDQNNSGLIAAPQGSYTLQVKDPTDKTIYEAPKIALSEFGSYASEFKTAPDALAGWYTFQVKSDLSDESWEPLRVLISDFSPAPFSVRAELIGDSFKSNQQVPVTTEARLYAGGPYSHAAARVKAVIKSQELTSSDPKTKGFTFSSLNIERDISEIEQSLDAKGDLQSSFVINEREIPYGELIVESSVRDDRGKSVASVTKARYIGRERFIGLANEDWILTSGKNATVNALVVDPAGSVITGEKVRIEIEYEETKVARVKAAGNVYTNRYETVWTAMHGCDLVSQAEATKCSFTPTKAGLYRFKGKVTDHLNREHITTLERWANGPGDVVWREGTNNQIKIIEEKTEYKVGETARFMVANPFPKAEALFSVERYGILRSWTQTLTESSAVIEIPITADLIPGFFFSAVLTSPRVEKASEGQVDLGKPTFRMGYSRVIVNDPAKRLLVDVVTEKPSYRPGDDVNVTLTPRDPKGTHKDFELAVTVIDQAVFDLLSAGKSYFDPYQGFYSLNLLDVKNYNLLRLLIGRQKFEKKGANPGGDGSGKLDMRSITKFVSYWNPAMRPDASGQVKFSFKAPDNLTGWAIFAMAFTKDERLGLGEGRFTVNKLTEARAALPNQVRVGDQVNAAFTVMNRSNQPRALNVEVQSEGQSIESSPLKMNIYAEPFKRYPIDFSVKAVQTGESLFVIKVGDTIDTDQLRVGFPVLEKTNPIISADFGRAENGSASLQIKAPKAEEASHASLKLAVSNSLLGDTSQTVRYMRDYSFGCWEQKISRAVVAAIALQDKNTPSMSGEWPSAGTVITETLNGISTYQAPSGGMSFYSPADERVSEYLSAFTALALTWLEELGYKVPIEPKNKLNNYLLSLLRNDTFNSDTPASSRVSIRSIASSALTKAGLITTSELSRLVSRLPEMTLFGRLSLLKSYLNLALPSKVTIDKITSNILNYGRESAQSYSLTEQEDRLSPWLLDSFTRTQCFALESLISAHEHASNDTKARLSTIIPRLARSVSMSRGTKGSWDNTQENAFCLRALTLYGDKYERTSDSLDIKVSVGQTFSKSLNIGKESGSRNETKYILNSADAEKLVSVYFESTPKAPFYYSSVFSHYPTQPQSSATNAGLEVTREYAIKRGDDWVALNNPVKIKRGDQIKVDLFVRVKDPLHFVVVNDPLAGGLEGVNKLFKTTSSLDNTTRGFEGPASSLWFKNPTWREFGDGQGGFYFSETKHEAVRFYSEYLAPGNYHLSYFAQAIATGEFSMLPTHAEAMYDPDIFGDSASNQLYID